MQYHEAQEKLVVFTLATFECIVFHATSLKKVKVWIATTIRPKKTDFVCSQKSYWRCKRVKSVEDPRVYRIFNGIKPWCNQSNNEESGQMSPMALERGTSSYTHCPGLSQTSLGIEPHMWKTDDSSFFRTSEFHRHMTLQYVNQQKTDTEWIL